MVLSKKAVENENLTQNIEGLLKKLDIEYKDISIYILSFVHRSIVNERPDFTPEHNERLEFLWDAVLELIITDNLFSNFPSKPEWDLTDMRSALVRWRNLALIAKSINFPDYLLLWKWEEKSSWRENDYILANTVESFLWAIYLDAWYEVAKKFVDKYIYTTLDSILKNNLFKDFKTVIQEYCQAEFDLTPTYKVLEESWPDHDKNFVVWVFMWNKLIWKWSWGSKKKAQEKSAEDWYNKLKNN